MRYRIAFIVLVVLSLTAPAPPLIYAQEGAHFGSGIVLLNPPEGEIVFVGALSSSGRYAAGTAISGGGTSPATGLHLWDLDRIDPDGPAVEPVPAATFDLASTLNGQTVAFDRGSVAFAPDESVLAVVLGDSIVLLSVPDLSAVQTISLPHPDDWILGSTLVWSPDSQYLAAARFGAEIDMWDRAAGQINRQPGSVTDLVPWGDGWLIEETSQFTICARQLEHCDSVPIQGEVMAVDAAHGVIVSGDLYGKTATAAWTRDDTERFTADAHAFDFLNGAGVPNGFSPSGRYMIVIAWTTGGSPDYPFWTLWDTQTRAPLYEVGDIRAPVWMGRDDYFVNGGGGVFYTRLSSTPLDVAQDLFTLPGIAEDTPKQTAEKLRLYHEVLGVQDVTADGSHFLLVLGGTALVQPVVLPDSP